MIAEDCRIGTWARIEGTPTLPSQHNSVILKNGVKVQSITILAKNVTVADEVRVQNDLILPHKEIKESVSGEVIM